MTTPGSAVTTVTTGFSGLAGALDDGSNIWVPNSGSASVSVVRASTGTVLATLTGNGLNTPAVVGFDGERILVANSGSVSLWKAAGLTPLGSVSMSGSPLGVCSDGLDFWVSLNQQNFLVRF